MRKVQRFSIATLGLAGLLALVSQSHAQRGAYIGYVYPAGGQQGTTVRVRLGGQRLDGVDRATVSGQGVSANVVKYFRPLRAQENSLLREQMRVFQQKTRAAKGKKPKRLSQAEAEVKANIETRMGEYCNRPACASLASLCWVEVSIAPDAEPGERELRLVTARGVTNPMPFLVGQVPEVAEQAILVSCDLCVIRPGIQEGFRRKVADRLEDFDINKLFLAATHTHAAPVLLQNRYQDYGDAMQPEAYVDFLFERMADAVESAWKTRAPGAVSWGLGHAVAGQNRRAVYRNGSAVMYGDTTKPDFLRIEGYEDHAVDVLCFYDRQQKLLAAAIVVACPAQSVGGGSLSADFWHDVRQLLRQRHGENLCVLGFCAPAGDQSPHLLLRKRSEQRMARLRGSSRTEELGRRIADAFLDVADVVAADIRSDVPFVHRVVNFDVPARRVTDAEYARSKPLYDALAGKEKLVGPDYWNKNFYKLTVDRYQAQQTADPRYGIEMHVLRLGDVAIATNPFELFVDYGVQIQGRSPAPQTVLIQLASPTDFGYYVPTPRAIRGGGYSAIIEQSLVGPHGGQALVDRTVKEIERLWKP